MKNILLVFAIAFIAGCDVIEPVGVDIKGTAPAQQRLATAPPKADPDPTPDPDPNPTPESGTADQRFMDLIANAACHAHDALNSAERVVALTRPPEPNPHFFYDPTENAVRMETSGAGISSKWQLRKYFEELGAGNADKIAFQWEVKTDESYLDTGGIQNYKAFQLSDSSEDLHFELQWRFSKTDKSAVAVPTVRYYKSISDSEATDKDPISSVGSQVSGGPMDNWQPGGDTAAGRRDDPFTAADHVTNETGKHSPFIIRPNKWIRYTVEFDYTDGFRFKLWMSDEDTPAKLVVASVAEPGKGLLLSSTYSLDFQNFWFEFNTSQTDAPPSTLKLWVKNFVAYKNESIALD